MTPPKMKAKPYDTIRTLVDIEAEFSDRVIPKGSVGIVVESYAEPMEGYSVDLEIPDASLVGGLDYENVTLMPDQFEVLASRG
jgi:hypothetical protein